MDFTLVSLFKFSCAFEFLPHFGYVSVDELGDDTSPFSGIVISLGYLIVLVVTIPLGYLNLDDNMIVQQSTLHVVLLSFVFFARACILSPPWSCLRTPSAMIQWRLSTSTCVWAKAIVITFHDSCVCARPWHCGDVDRRVLLHRVRFHPRPRCWFRSVAGPWTQVDHQ